MWDGTGIDAVPNSSNCSTDDELSSRLSALYRRHLNNDSNNHDCCAQYHGPAAADSIAKTQDEDSTN
jgi:hypothetical protein